MYAIFFTILISREGVHSIEEEIYSYFRRGKTKLNDAMIVKYMYDRFADDLPPYGSVFGKDNGVIRGIFFK